MDIQRIAQRLCDGTCWRNFTRMPSEKQQEIAFKVAGTALAAGLVTAVLTVPFSAAAAGILIPVIAVGGGIAAFAYLTHKHAGFDQGIDFIRQAASRVSNAFDEILEGNALDEFEDGISDLVKGLSLETGTKPQRQQPRSQPASSSSASATQQRMAAKYNFISKKIS